MNIVLLESLGIPDSLLEQYAAQLAAAGHTFTAYPRTGDTARLIEEARDADVLMLANMPLPGGVIRACTHLKFIDVAFTGVDHVDLDAAREMGAAVSNASGYSNDSVAELTVCMALALLRNLPQVEERCRTGGTKDGLVGQELRGKTVGLVGTGAIGSRVAQLFSAFGVGITLIALCTLGMAGLGFLVGKALKRSFWLSFAITLNAYLGFPINVILTNEALDLNTEEGEERAIISGELMPPMLVGSFVCVTIVSVIVAGVLIKYI